MWRTMATILGAPEQYRFEVTDTGIHAAPGQGLDALMDLTYKPDLSLTPEGGHDEFCQPGCDSQWCWEPAYYLLADFDTAYGATDPCGCHSGGIHIRLVSQLGRWLDEQGATWMWCDESGDLWHHGSDWGTLGDPREACPLHRSIPAPRSALVS
jgi:hypothetical protein